MLVRIIMPKSKYWQLFIKELDLKLKNNPELSKTKFQKIIIKAIRNSIKLNHRRLFILASKDIQKHIEYSSAIIQTYVRIKKSDNISLLFVSYDPSNPPDEIFINSLSQKLRKTRIKIEKIPFSSSIKVMGRTYEIVIIDFTRDLPPNEIGRIVETARGGGLIIFIVPPILKWAELKTYFHRYITTIPWKLEDIRGLFVKRLIRKLFEHKGIYIFDLDRTRILKEHSEKKIINIFQRQKPQIPKETSLPRKIYELAITRDQIKALVTMEKLLRYPKKDKRKVITIIADRGRGKSAVVGLFLGAIAKINAGKGAFGRFMVLVTAPNEYNVYTLFQFAEIALKTLGEKPRISYDPLEIRGKGYIITFISPRDATKIAKREKVEILAIDEASGIPVPILFKLLESAPRLIYSSTIHGYEGAGRGFSIRFLAKLKEKEDIEYYSVDLNEPIRYSANDPIEKWLFDALLLDAEPADLNDKDLQDINAMNVHLEKANLDEWFLGPKEKDLRQFIGIYVFAHYRNQPKDLAILADAPHYETYALRLPSGKIVCALLVAVEGGLPASVIRAVYKDKAAEPSGHLIPVAIEKHYRDTKFPTFLGYRIVRIATHPKVMNKGLGSRALEELVSLARKRGFAWVGAGFGANVQLMNFWLKNKFVPIHVSPMRHKVSGEYTTIVIRPLRKELENLIRIYYREFRIRFVEWLRYVHYDMEPELALTILKKGYIWERIEHPYRYRPLLTDIQAKRILAYKLGILSYELVSDAIQALVKAYFIDEDPTRPEINEIAELILLCRVLQARTWSQTLELINADLTRKKATKLFTDAVISLYNYFIKSDKN